MIDDVATVEAVEADLDRFGARRAQEAKSGRDRANAEEALLRASDRQRAESRVRFSEARLEAARRIEEEAERERLGRVEALGRHVVSELDPEPIRELAEAAKGALAAYVAACVARNATLEGITRELEGLGPLPDGYAVDRTRLIGPRLLVGPDFEAGWLRPMVDVSEMARAALREHIPRGYIDLEQPY
ncbi:MAG: hypothetical protein M3Q60_20340 [Actinomycetota bacterium]|nr:hypothetical protein [Actinomycetota bacterium]